MQRAAVVSSGPPRALRSSLACDRFVLRDNVLMYFNSPKDFTGFRDKPSGVVLLEEGNVRTVDTGALQKYTFMLAHPNGESVVLAAETEKEMHEWMQAGADATRHPRRAACAFRTAPRAIVRALAPSVPRPPYAPRQSGRAGCASPTPTRPDRTKRSAAPRRSTRLRAPCAAACLPPRCARAAPLVPPPPAAR